MNCARIMGSIHFQETRFPEKLSVYGDAGAVSQFFIATVDDPYGKRCRLEFGAERPRLGLEKLSGRPAPAFWQWLPRWSEIQICFSVDEPTTGLESQSFGPGRTNLGHRFENSGEQGRD